MCEVGEADLRRVRYGWKADMVSLRLVPPENPVMAYLVAVQVANGDWHAHIVAHPSVRYRGDTDVLGKKVPHFCFIEVWDGIRKEDAARLAYTLKGVSKGKRRDLILETARSLRLSARGGTIKNG